MGWVPGIAYPVGTEVRFRAGRLDFLAECDLPADFAVEWTTSAPAVAVIDSKGVLRGVSPGKAEVIARGRGEEQRFAVTVTPTVARIEILPGDTSIMVGDTVRFRAVAYGTDGRAIPDAVVAMQATDSIPSVPGGPRPGIDDVTTFGLGAPLHTTNVMRLYARRAGASGFVTAWVMGRADTVQVRTVTR